MPARTNTKQQIIEMLKALLAPQGCTVTPSKSLTDRELNVPREVDIVAEVGVDGHVFTQSFEVVARSRPMDLTWVDGILRKHSTLPTDRLYLVSWSGFTEDALRRAQQMPNTFAVSVSPASGAAELYADQIDLRMKRVRLHVRLPDGKSGTVTGLPDLGIYSADGKVQGALVQLGTWLLQRPVLGQLILQAVHDHPRRDEMRWFELKLPLDSPPLDNLFLKFEETNALHPIAAINLQGELGYSQQRVDLSLKNFGVHLFGHGEAILGGQRHLVVATVDLDAKVERVDVAADKTDAARAPKPK